MVEASGVLSTRKKAILNILVRDYIHTASPVGSAQVARHPALGVSPATVRNDMAELEEEGYISRRHVSGGGVPSDKGYRFYVEHMGQDHQPPSDMRWLVQHRFRVVSREPEAWSRVAATILSQAVRNVAMVTFPSAIQSRLKYLQLVRLQEFLALLVLVLQSARVRQQLLRLPDNVAQQDLTALANKLSARFAEKDRHQMAVMPAEEVSPLEALVTREAHSLMEAEDRAAFRDVWVEGLRHMLAQPEFASGQRAREVAEVVEDRELVSNLLTAVQGHPGVCVLIGEENGRDLLRPFSVVLCQYGIPGQSMGVVGVMGPTRLDYTTAIAGVQYISLCMGRLLAGLYGYSP
ncbi:MAG: heat-inducible transcription repressor HrcA [Chloroflexi bacterium]|nr:heat-inducible transcription repressor HrcA [Chloroflexota bacterium]